MKLHNNKRNIKQDKITITSMTSLHKITWPQYIEGKTKGIGKTDKYTLRIGYFNIFFSQTEMKRVKKKKAKQGYTRFKSS